MQRPFRQLALRLIANGFSPVPLDPRTGHPALSGWQDLCDTTLSLREFEIFASSRPGASPMSLWSIDV